MASVTWQRITIAIAAAASVATSQLPEQWNVLRSVSVDRVVLDRAAPKAVYAIHAEVTGPGPYTDLGAYVTTYINPRATGTFTSLDVLRVTLRSITNPGVESVEERVLPESSGYPWGDIAAFTHCATPPCGEDFELVVELVGGDGLAVEIGGNVEISVSGDNYDLERTTQVTFTASRVP
jgi:hypothetical protein